MKTLAILRFLSIIIVALLAGVSLGIWIGFNPMNLSATAYLEQQQNMLGALRVLMVVLVFLAALLTLVSGYLQRKNRASSITLLIASFFLIACILITRFGNKPIDDIMLTWTTDAIPDDWKNLRDKWWSLHIARTLTELIALGLITWTNVRKDN